MHGQSDCDDSAVKEGRSDKMFASNQFFGCARDTVSLASCDLRVDILRHLLRPLAILWSGKWQQCVFEIGKGEAVWTLNRRTMPKPRKDTITRGLDKSISGLLPTVNAILASDMSTVNMLCTSTRYNLSIKQLIRRPNSEEQSATLSQLSAHPRNSAQR